MTLAQKLEEEKREKLRKGAVNLSNLNVDSLMDNPDKSTGGWGGMVKTFKQALVKKQQERKIRKKLYEGDYEEAVDAFYEKGFGDEYKKPLPLGCELDVLDAKGESVRCYFSLML